MENYDEKKTLAYRLGAASAAFILILEAFMVVQQLVGYHVEGHFPYSWWWLAFPFAILFAAIVVVYIIVIAIGLLDYIKEIKNS